jgi:hypothetical protein
LSNVVAIAGGIWHTLALRDPVPIRQPLLGKPNLSERGYFEFDLTGEFGHRYVVETSPDLTHWEFVRNCAGMSSPVHIVHELRGDTPSRFYRARVTQ